MVQCIFLCLPLSCFEVVFKRIPAQRPSAKTCKRHIPFGGNPGKQDLAGKPASADKAG